MRADRESRKVVVPASCGSCPIRGVTVCRAFLPNRLAQAAKLKAGDRILRTGTVLVAQGAIGHGPYHLMDGWLAVRQVDRSGRTALKDVLLPGSFLGYSEHPDVPSEVTIQALTTSSICLFRRPEFDRAMRGDHDLSDALVATLLQDRDRAYMRLHHLQTPGAQRRVALFLLDIWERVSQLAPHYIQGHCIHVPMTQHDLADALCMTPIYVNRHLRDLRAHGVIDYHDRDFVFRDLLELSRIAYGELAAHS